MKKHSLTLRGHRTSISLEDAFWQQLRTFAKADGLSLQELVESIDKARSGNLSSALRVYVLQRALKK